MVTVNDSFRKIEQYVLELEERTSPAVWDQIYQNPISTNFIDGLVEQRWKVWYNSDRNFTGSFSESAHIIYLADYLKPHQRDMVLFHELVHLRHPIILSSSVDARMTPFGKNSREIIVEYLGRKARADHDLLRHAVLSFGLDAQIYDLPSYKAFKDVKEQQNFSFMKDWFPLRMDYQTSPFTTFKNAYSPLFPE